MVLPLDAEQQWRVSCARAVEAVVELILNVVFDDVVVLYTAVTVDVAVVVVLLFVVDRLPKSIDILV